MNNISEVSLKQCSGCGLCYSVCPTKCIEIVPDEEGFLRPSLDARQCVSCGKCLSKCPIKSSDSFLHEQGKFCIACSKDGFRHTGCSSGGIFYQLAKYYIDVYGAVVFGCRLNENGMPEIVHAENGQDLTRLLGSKYVQSNPNNCYEECKRFLEAGRKVLFCGTPCQIAAVKNFVGNDSNLFAIDLICHGTPSSKLWRRYVDSLVKEGRITNASKLKFRYTNDYERTHFSIVEQGGSYVSNWQKDVYYNLFMTFSSLRDSCYECPFAQKGRVGDITLGDCSSYKSYPNFHPLEPASCVIVNTSKGQTAFDAISKTIDSMQIDDEMECKLNHALSHPEERPETRNQVYEDLNTLTWEQFCERYTPKLSARQKAVMFAKSHIPVKVRQSLKATLKR